MGHIHAPQGQLRAELPQVMEPVTASMTPDTPISKHEYDAAFRGVSLLLQQSVKGISCPLS